MLRDSLKADSLFELAWKYRNNYPDSSYHYAVQSLKLAEKNNFTRLIAYNLGRIGEYYRNRTLYNNADKYLKKSLKVRIAYKDTNDIFNGYINLGNLFIYQEKFDSAIFYFKEGLTYGTPDRFLSQQGKTLNGLSVAYVHSGDYELAEITLNEALDIAIRLNDSLSLAKRYQNLAGFYEKIGRYELALKNYELCKQIYEVRNDDLGIVDVQINVASVFLQLEKYEEAIRMLKLAETTSYERGFLRKRLSILNNLGFAYHAIDELEKADRVYKEGLNYASKNDQKKAFIDLTINYSYLLKTRKRYHELLERSYFLENLIREEQLNQFLFHVYLLRADAQAGLGNFKEAFQLRLKFFTQQDSLAKKIDDAQALAAEIEQEKSEKALLKERNLRQETELKKQKAENRSKTIGIWALVLLLIALVFIFLLKLRNSRIKLKAEEEKQRSEEELHQLLNKIDLEILEKQVEAREKATYQIGQNLHDTLGSKLAVAQMSFDNIKDKIVNQDSSVSKQLDRISNLLEESCNDTRSISHKLMEQDLADKGLEYAVGQQIERLQGIKNINFHFIPIGIPPNINGAIQQEILNIIRTLIENILRHSGAKEAIIQIRRENHLLHVSIEDDGNGFDVEYALNNGGTGLRNAKQRTEKLGGEFRVESSKEGTQLMLFIPFKFQKT